MDELKTAPPPLPVRALVVGPDTLIHHPFTRTKVLSCGPVKAATLERKERKRKSFIVASVRVYVTVDCKQRRKNNQISWGEKCGQGSGVFIRKCHLSKHDSHHVGSTINNVVSRQGIISTGWGRVRIQTAMWTIRANAFDPASRATSCSHVVADPTHPTSISISTYFLSATGRYQAPTTWHTCTRTYTHTHTPFKDGLDHKEMGSRPWRRWGDWRERERGRGLVS